MFKWPASKSFGISFIRTLPSSGCRRASVSAIRVSNDVQGHSRAAVRPELEKHQFRALVRPLASAARHQAPAFKSGQRNPPSLQASQPRISTQVPGQTPRPESNSDKPETLDHYCRKVLLTYHESQQRAPLNRQLSVAQQGSLRSRCFPGLGRERHQSRRLM